MPVCPESGIPNLPKTPKEHFLAWDSENLLTWGLREV